MLPLVPFLEEFGKDPKRLAIVPLSEVKSERSVKFDAGSWEISEHTTCFCFLSDVLEENKITLPVFAQNLMAIQ